MQEQIVLLVSGGTVVAQNPARNIIAGGALAAKPIIDILVGVSDLALVREEIALLWWRWASLGIGIGCFSATT